MKTVTTDFNNVDSKGRLCAFADGTDFHPGEQVIVSDPEGLLVHGYVDGTDRALDGTAVLVFIRPQWNTMEILP